MSQKHYLLIDGVSWPEAMRDLYRRNEPLKIEPLYSGTRFVALQDVGPILVQINAPSPLAREWAASEELQARSSSLCSRSSMQDVSAHLRRFIQPSYRNGSTSLLRFCAPLVLHQWLSSYSATERDQVLGPIERVQVKTPTLIWASPATPSVTRFDRQEPPAVWQDHFGLLGEAQLDALAQVDRWTFEERLYAWLLECNPQTFSGFDSEQISQWFTQVLDSGQAWGLSTERGLKTWAVICADWGVDFVSRPDSPYQNWLKAEPLHYHLAAELRIAALGQYRPKDQMTKDTAHG
jgi:hypothetical protein